MQKLGKLDARQGLWKTVEEACSVSLQLPLLEVRPSLTPDLYARTNLQGLPS